MKESSELLEFAKRQNYLIVDDEKLVYDVIEKVFKYYDFKNVVIRDSPQGALDYLHENKNSAPENRTNFVISDYIMHPIYGTEMMRRAKESPINFVGEVLFMSGTPYGLSSRDTRLKEYMRDFGLDPQKNFLYKPMTIESLLERVIDICQDLPNAPKRNLTYQLPKTPQQASGISGGLNYPLGKFALQ